jgi:hypothetical protein
VRLEGGTSEVLWTRGAGLVHARCLRTGQLWDLTPMAGGWSWLMVGKGDSSSPFWTHTFSDGFNEPVTLYDRNLTAHGALWDAASFLEYEVELHLEATRAQEAALAQGIRLSHDEARALAPAAELAPEAALPVLQPGADGPGLDM